MIRKRTTRGGRKRGEGAHPKVIHHNLAKHTYTYWDINSLYNQRGENGRSMTFEEASKKIRNAKNRLGPHRKVLKKLDQLQDQLILGAKPRCRVSKKKRNQCRVLQLIPRT